MKSRTQSILLNRSYLFFYHSKIYLYLFLWLILLNYFYFQSFSQGIGINSTGVPANPDAGLDVDFNNRGVLIPRVNITNLNQFNPPITSGGNTTSLIVYNTNNTIGEGYYYWDGNRWVKLLIDIDAWLTNGNVGTNPTNNFIGTIDNTDLVIRTNNIEKLRVSSGGAVTINNSTPNNDAGLDINFSDRGLLIPRVSIPNLNQFNPPITNGGNTTSLLVYNTNTTTGEGFYYWNGTRWVKFLIDTDAWLTLGNNGTNPNNNFIGTIDNTSLVFRTNNTEKMRLTNTGRLGIATANPDVSVHINTTDAIRIPTGTTAQQPAAPPQGAMRYNTTKGAVEIWTGTCWMNVNTPPVGATYIQWYNSADPNTIYPCTQWIATDITNGAFIRARGGEANVAANAALTGTVQQHAIQQHNHTGTVTINNSFQLTTSNDGSHSHSVLAAFHGITADNLCNNCGFTRLFYGDDFFYYGCNSNLCEQSFSTTTNGNHNHTVPPHNHTGTITINNNTGTNANANETRPTNVAVIFWRRIN